MKLKNTLRDLLKQRGLTIRDLSKAISVPESTIKTWLAGSNPRSIDDIKKCATYFGVSLDFLFFAEESGLPKSVDELPLEDVFSGWLKVKVQRAIPIKRKDKKDE